MGDSSIADSSVPPARADGFSSPSAFDAADPCVAHLERRSDDAEPVVVAADSSLEILVRPTVSIPASAISALQQIRAHLIPPVNVEPETTADLWPSRVVSVSAGTRQLRVVCLSDTHGLHAGLSPENIPAGDILLHCGDFTKRGTLKEVVAFNQFMQRLPHRIKLLVGGNHDLGVFSEFQASHAAELVTEMRYLDNDLIEMEGLRIYGCSWDKQGARKVPEDVDILITHEPPQGILDGDGKGCQYLRRDVESQRPRLHVFGHIHEASGVFANSCTTFVNAALANDGMVSKRLDKPITVVELHPR